MVSSVMGDDDSPPIGDCVVPHESPFGAVTVHESALVDDQCIRVRSPGGTSDGIARSERSMSEPSPSPPPVSRAVMMSVSSVSSSSTDAAAVQLNEVVVTPEVSPPSSCAKMRMVLVPGVV